MNCYILHTFLLVIILLFIITIICYHYVKYRLKQKRINNELKKVCIKNRACYYFDGIIEIEDFNFDNILLDKKILQNHFDL